jgi:AcrR family transcriptional regulator
VDKATEIRARILDAAEGCLLDGGFRSGRLHSTIAARAGLSRPTLYKYVGDQDAISNALIHRELTRFLELLAPILEARAPIGEHLVTVLTFVVDHARNHPLLRAALRDVPEQVLPSFTTHAGVLIERVELVTRPHLQRRIDSGELPDVDPRLLIDALSRVAISMVFTNGLVDLTDPDTLRGYLGAMGLILSGIRSPSAAG